jgi:kinetochore protein Mis13/DSN1
MATFLSTRLLSFSVQPHDSVSDDSLSRHIDTDVPESDRLRHLLTWSFSRATSSSSPTSSQKKKPPSQPSRTLSTKAADYFESFEREMVKMVVERKVDVDSILESTPRGQTGLRENPQNVSNRRWEVIYTADNERYVLAQVSMSSHVLTLVTVPLKKPGFGKKLRHYGIPV